MTTIESLVKQKKLERIYNEIYELLVPIKDLPKKVRKRVSNVETFTSVKGEEIVFVHIDSQCQSPNASKCEV